MPGQDAITVEGRIVEKLRDGLFRARLANGHQVVAHPTRATREQAGGLRIGDRVDLALSPFDMSTGRIVGSAADDGKAESENAR